MKNSIYSLVFCACILVIGWSTAIATDRNPATIWISPNDPTHGGAQDFWDMLTPDAPWQRAKNKVGVFKIAQNLVANGPPAQLRTFSVISSKITSPSRSKSAC